MLSVAVGFLRSAIQTYYNCVLRACPGVKLPQSYLDTINQQMKNYGINCGQYKYACARVHTYKHRHTRSHTHAHTRARTRARAHTHTHTGARARTHARTGTYEFD